MAEPLDGPVCQELVAIALRHRIALVAGVVETSDEPDRAYNTLVAFGPDGGRLAFYRKIHLFDAQGFGESTFIKPGPSTARRSPWGGACWRIRWVWWKRTWASTLAFGRCTFSLKRWPGFGSCSRCSGSGGVATAMGENNVLVGVGYWAPRQLTGNTRYLPADWADQPVACHHPYVQSRRARAPSIKVWPSARFRIA
ncbi:nitrilase-related carbon-nitrogen hydrolase [Pseudarthrobacter enclensis]|uniref:nitrilase-related carbon-nitrogen hydrolase n=1 Tax=Pseudarthrobacter enclensis TaxID=993070 RepID=UPI00341C341F